MMKKKLFLFVISLIIGVIGGGKSYAQGWTDVTSTYITNANLSSISNDADTDVAFWPVYTTGRTGNKHHPKNWYLHTNGTTNHNGGGDFFECWAASQGVKRWTLFQDITLPAGQYKLTGQYSTNENRGIIKTVAITPHHTYFSSGITTSNWGSWGSETTEFTIYEETQVRIGMISTNFAQNHGFTLETKGAKQLLADVIAAAPTGVSTTEAQAVYDDGGSDDAAYRTAAKTLHDAIVAKNITNASTESPVDMTNRITNPSFEGVGGASPYLNAKHDFNVGWSYPTVNDGKAVAATTDGYLITDNTEDGFYYANLWKDSPITYYVKQTLSALPAGRYILTARYASDANNTASLYMGTTANQQTITAEDKSKFVSGSVIYDLEATGDVEIGMTSEAWMKADGFTLSYVGDPLNAAKNRWQNAYNAAVSARDDAAYTSITGAERTALLDAIALTPNTIETYGTAADALIAATDEFNATNVSYYALLATEKTKASNLGMTNEAIASATAATKTGLKALQDLKVAEYNYVTGTYQYGVTLGTWHTTGYTSDNSGQHWDGESSTQYKEQENSWGDPKKGYAADSWTIAFDQSIELPAGNYIFKVAGRKAAGTKTTMSLDVTKTSDDSSLGSVNDFPEGDTGLGINKAGATSFDPEDAAGFANEGAGRGWEWRYVKFTLLATTTVKIAVNAEATDYSQWMSFCNYTLQTDNEANISLIAYNIALNDAKSAINSTDYSNVTGSERTELEEIIAGDAALNKTNKTAIDAAKSSLETKTTAFTDAKDAYDAFVAAKATEYENNLPYASATKFAAIATAQAAADATSAADATTKTNAIISAYRKYVESNALAEGVDGAEAIVISDPNMDVTYNSETHKFGAWQVIGQTTGNIQLLSGESFTDGDGKHDYKYADIYKNDNNAGIQQTVNLEAGTYILTVTARANNTAGAAFWVFAGDKKQNIERIGNTGGVFDRGWNDCTLEFEVPEKSDVNIGVQSGNGKDLWWSATRFRLMKIKEGANMKITDAKWATFVAPFDVTIPDGVTAYTITGVSGTSLVKEVVETTIPANKPVLLNSESEVNQTFYGKAVAGTPTNGLLTGVYVDNTPATVGTYVLEKHDTAVNFYKVEGAGIVINANRAYLTVPASVKMFSLDDDEEPTAIEGIDIAAGDYDAIYTPTGVKVESLQKGLNIVVKGEKSYKIFVK